MVPVESQLLIIRCNTKEWMDDFPIVVYQINSRAMASSMYAIAMRQSTRRQNQTNYLEIIALLVLSALCSGLGNSLEPISILAWLHIFILLWGITLVCDSSKSGQSHIEINCLLQNVFIQSVGTLLGFAGTITYPTTTIWTLLETFGFGLLIWITYSVLAIVPHYLCSKRFPGSPYLVFVFPLGYTFVSHTILGHIFSVFFTLSNALIDFEPLRQVSSIFGLAGVTFLATLLVSSAVQCFLQRRYATVTFKIILFVYVLVLTLAQFLAICQSFYQKNVQTQIVPTLDVSCVMSQSAPLDSMTYDQLWSNTRTRISRNDTFVLWAEEAVVVSNDMEELLLVQTAVESTRNSSSYLGITYLKKPETSSTGTNHFVLVSPSGHILWDYLKSHPVPFVESDIAAGPSVLPTYATRYGIIGGAICFDLDYPEFLRQAGQKQVNILLQPSWTWGALSSRHFEGNAIRAIENGFTLFRCSSNGESGIVTPHGKFVTRKYTGEDPTEVSVFSLPLNPNIRTLYSQGGYLFEYVCAVAYVLLYIILLLPDRILGAILSCGSGRNFDRPPLSPRTMYDYEAVPSSKGTAALVFRHTQLNAIAGDSEEDDVI